MKSPLPLIAVLLALLSLPALSAASPKPDWKAFADCAAAYRANAQIKDPDRSKDMTASIQEVGDDYLKAAISQRRPRNDAAVKAYVAGRVPVFAAQPRAKVEKVIEACPAIDP